MSLVTLCAKASDLDSNDPLKHCRHWFRLPQNTIYLDGNSLGPMPAATTERIVHTLEKEWAEGLIRSWNDAEWINLPETVAQKLAPLLGANPESVTISDSTSVNVFKVLAAALDANSTRTKIVSEKGNFPTDLYVAEGVKAFLKRDINIELVENDEGILASVDDDTAVLMLTHVDFRTGRLHDMERITAAAQEKGALVIWDLAHSAGALPLALDRSNVDFAVGCGYKYLNGGPGAPAFVYVNQRLLGKVSQPVTGWFSHRAPFSFDHRYAADLSIKQFLCGTPPVLSMVALDEALKLWDTVDLEAVRSKSVALTNLFIEAIEEIESSSLFDLVTPRKPENRGSQVSVRFKGDGYALMQALISNGVIGDYRDPDILRFGFAPLYNSFGEVIQAVQTLERILKNGEWQSATYSRRKAVT